MWYLLLGSRDSVERQRLVHELAGPDFLSFDAKDGEDVLIAALSGPTLFGGRPALVVAGAEHLRVGVARTLVARDGGTTVILWSESSALGPLVKALGDKVQVRDLSPSTGVALVERLASEEGVALEAGEAALAAARVGDHPDVLRSALRARALVGPSFDWRTTWESTPELAPWELARLLERGDTKGFWAGTANRDLIGFVTYYLGRLAQLRAASEVAGRSGDVGLVRDALGVGEGAARSLVRDARRLGTRRLDLLRKGTLGLDVVTKTKGSELARVELLALCAQLAQETRGR